MSISEKETKIIKRIYTNRKTNNPLLVVYPNGEEVWCQTVDIHDSRAGIEHINPDTQEIDFK